jgi:imidazolonepropionase-like amidohydrolase
MFPRCRSAAGFASLINCSPRSEWRSIHYAKVLLDNFCLFDGVKNGLQKDQIVLIEGDKILGIERKGDLAQYKGFRHFDLNGWTLLPGFIDNYVHMTYPYVIMGKQNVLFRFRTRDDDYVERIL